MKEMDIMQKEFDKKQKALIAAGVVPADAILITSENKIQRVVEQCRRSHGGPITDEAEVENILAKYSDDKGKKSALVLEIRYRKFTVLNIKESNPLFKQQNLTVEQLSTNLKLLLQKTDLSLSSTATMTDLEHVLSKDKSQAEAPASSEALSDSQLNVWPPEVGEHVVVNCEGGWEVGEVVEVTIWGVKVSFMKQKKVAAADKGEHPRRFWVWPARKEVLDTEEQYVVPVRPDLMVAKPPSTRRMVVFSVENADIIDKFVE